ncbi:uncharacterized protein NECHADRAFT_83458 [Fusarium vanettenii 77-13-4]|uniref:Uncharacterized protein n=1 Tax=Fusarium vanettenii (strain ATCC MYA-4622 / CBS 123669 / FGSC 9596 / NRRL 45880 / 77-13-4) TaxID=660122 RepID=C7Z429_FUSV7|nr:uncharacterized protein NECHADRAFT_83458 [Fusarium vanettenii 77-13-4]EEU41247.1 hypothetical protein NECHADRAFT_83458 [Fusarium vanettenii 77-13-4]
MTTNADFTFTPHPSPEEIQDEWNLSLHGIEDEGENQAVIAHLRSIWRDNWWKYPDKIKQSFLNAARKTATTKTNIHSPCSHTLYRGAFIRNTHDFDWGVWLVLRGIYYDSLKDAATARAEMTRQTFARSPATKAIMQRYQDIDVLEDNVPLTFPPRPSSWEKKLEDGPGGSCTPPKTKDRTPAVKCPATNKTGGTGDGTRDSGVGSSTEMAKGEGVGSPSPDKTKTKVKKEAKKHTSAPSQGTSSHPRTNLDTTPSDSKTKAISIQGPVNEGGQREKSTNASNNSKVCPEEPSTAPKRLPKRSLSDDEEESQLRIKRRSTSSDQSRHSPEVKTEAIPNGCLQIATFNETLEHIYERIKKPINEKATEYVSQQVTQHLEDLQPRLKDLAIQLLSEMIPVIPRSSESSTIAQQIADSMAEQVLSIITGPVIQKLTTRLISELQPVVDKQIANGIAQHLLENLFGSTGSSEL